MQATMKFIIKIKIRPCSAVFRELHMSSELDHRVKALIHYMIEKLSKQLHDRNIDNLFEKNECARGDGASRSGARRQASGTFPLEVKDERLKKAQDFWNRVVAMDILNAAGKGHVDFLYFHYKHSIEEKLLEMMWNDQSWCKSCCRYGEKAEYSLYTSYCRAD